MTETLTLSLESQGVSVTSTASVSGGVLLTAEGPQRASLELPAREDLPAAHGVILHPLPSGDLAFGLPLSEDDPIVGFTAEAAVAGDLATVHTAGQKVEAAAGAAVPSVSAPHGRALKIGEDGKVYPLAGAHSFAQTSQAVLLSPAAEQDEIVEIFFFGGRLPITLPPDAG